MQPHYFQSSSLHENSDGYVVKGLSSPLILTPLVVALVVLAVLVTSEAEAASVDLGDLEVPATRIPDWNPGVDGEAPATDSWPVTNAADFGAVPNDGASDAAAINAAIAHAASLGGNRVVSLPIGTYRFEELEWIQMRSNVVLRGDGPDKTVITGDSGYGGSETGGTKGGIKFVGTRGAAVDVTNPTLPRGATSLSVADPAGFQVGDWVYLVQDNDPSYITNPAGGKFYMSHIFKVISKSGSSLVMDRPLRHSFAGAQNPRVQKMTVVENSGIEDLTAQFDEDFQFSGCGAPGNKCYWSPDGAPVMFHGAVNCWARNVNFYNGGKYHLWIAFSARNTITGSRFERVLKTERSLEVGEDPSSNYSIELGEGAHDNLITNNISVDHLTVINIARGASGNVFSYNFIVGSRVRKGIMFHGQYPHENLIEGNDTYGPIEIGDNWWGQQGPRNTAFRNRMRATGYMAQNRFNEMFVVDEFNVILNSAFTFFTKNFCQPNTHGANDEGKCRDFDYLVTNLWAERNISRDTRPDFIPVASSKYGWVVRDKEPSSTFVETETVSNQAPSEWSDLSFPPSLYLTGPPSFWEPGMPWPAIGADVDDFNGQLVKLPAQRRYEGTIAVPAAPILLD